jgi:hypothetical protein
VPQQCVVTWVSREFEGVHCGNASGSQDHLGLNLRQQPCGSAASPVLTDLDFANDGTPDTLVELGLESGSGPGCDAVFFDMLDEKEAALATGSRRGQLLALQEIHRAGRWPAPCGSRAQFLEWRGQDERVLQRPHSHEGAIA